jgi:hypothetical protein
MFGLQLVRGEPVSVMAGNIAPPPIISRPTVTLFGQLAAHAASSERTPRCDWLTTAFDRKKFEYISFSFGEVGGKVSEPFARAANESVPWS